MSALPQIALDAWLSADAVGKEFFVTGNSVQAWRRRGFIPRAYLKKTGKRRWKFHPALVPFIKKKIDEANCRPRAERLQVLCKAAAEQLHPAS